MKSAFTLLLMGFAIFISSCNKNEFDKNKAIEAQKELLKLKYQHEIDLETLKQKGATAMQELLNKAALEQIRLNDSLRNAHTIDARKADYSITVTDVLTNAPIADADVMVSSEGKLYSTKTNAQGVATFTTLYLFPTSTFLVSKTGYTAAQIMQQYIAQEPVRLWNTRDLSNEIYGTLYIDTDLTTPAPEKVGAGVLVTAGTTISTGANNSYSAYFPAYTKADGSYSIEVPAAPNDYTLNFQQINADQKLYVNATEEDPVNSFPETLPRLETIKTNFLVNNFLVDIPYINSPCYFKFSPDKTGHILYIPANYNSIYLSPIGNKFQIEKLRVTNVSNATIARYFYVPEQFIDVELVDITGKLIEKAPKLSGFSSSYGTLSYIEAIEGEGYVIFKRQTWESTEPDSKGVITKAGNYDGSQYYFWVNGQLNFANLVYTSTTIPLKTNGQKYNADYYYGAGDNREKQVY